MTTAILFGLGLGIGALGTLIGAGGGWMIVPILLLGYGFAPQQAVGTSLAVVFLNALSGSIAYMAQRRVLYRMGTAFAAATIPGALLGGLILGLVENLAAGYLDPLVGGGVREVAAYVMLLIILLIKPYGLSGQVRIERI